MNKRQHKKWLSKRCKHSYADARCQVIKDYIKEIYDDEYSMYYILDSRRGGYKHILKIIGFKNAYLKSINTGNDSVEETTEDYSFSCESNSNVLDMLNRWKEALYDENQQTNTRSDGPENAIKR